MSTKLKKKPVYTVSGEAMDQETIIRQRPLIEDYVRENVKSFRKTKVVWSMNEKGFFDFSVLFYD